MSQSNPKANQNREGYKCTLRKEEEEEKEIKTSITESDGDIYFLHISLHFLLECKFGSEFTLRTDAVAIEVKYNRDRAENRRKAAQQRPCPVYSKTFKL